MPIDKTPKKKLNSCRYKFILLFYVRNVQLLYNLLSHISYKISHIKSVSCFAIYHIV